MIHLFLPVDLQDRTTERGRRAHLFVQTWLPVLAMHVLAAAVSLFVRGPNPLAMTLGIIVVGLAFTPLLLRSRWPRLAPMAFLFLIFAGIAGVSWRGYGPFAPATIALSLLNLLAVVFGGLRLGLAFSTLCAIHLALLYGAEIRGFPFPMDADGPTFLTLHYMVQATMLAVSAAIIAAYDGAWARAADELEQARAEVVRANEAKSVFLANMSHELRTPLNAVIGYAELLEEDGRSDQIDDLHHIQNGGRHLLSLVNDILDLAKVESGRMEMATRPVDLYQLVTELKGPLEPLAAKNGNQLDFDLSSAFILADPRRVRQIVLNLVSNAAKFTTNGTISVTLQSDERVLLLVADTGIGMTATDLAHIFDPFRQAEAGKGQGTGLGLAISRQLAEAMEATLTAESTPGVGTTFFLSFPSHQ